MNARHCRHGVPDVSFAVRRIVGRCRRAALDLYLAVLLAQQPTQDFELASAGDRDDDPCAAPICLRPDPEPDRDRLAPGLDVLLLQVDALPIVGRRLIGVGEALLFDTEFLLAVRQFGQRRAFFGIRPTLLVVARSELPQPRMVECQPRLDPLPALGAILPNAGRHGFEFLRRESVKQRRIGQEAVSAPIQI